MLKIQISLDMDDIDLHNINFYDTFPLTQSVAWCPRPDSKNVFADNRKQNLSV